MSRSIGGYLNDLLDGKKSKQETVTLLQKQREKFAAKKVKEAIIAELKTIQTDLPTGHRWNDYVEQRVSDLKTNRE